jgi:2-C-methyl-D-erythritol 4-phosphate cytidylyltransferase
MKDKLDLVFLCAGRGTRVGLDVPKQFAEIGGKPVMIHSLEVYESSPLVGRKIIVHDVPEAGRILGLLRAYDITNYLMVEGGVTRQDSVRRGLAQARTERIFTHNAAVPFLTHDMIENVAAPGADCVTTSTALEDNLLQDFEGSWRPVPRKDLRFINSPQCFRLSALRDAHASAERDGIPVSSDCEIMLHYGHTVELVPGPPWNFKITDKIDLALAETLLLRSDLFPELAK